MFSYTLPPCRANLVKRSTRGRANLTEPVGMGMRLIMGNNSLEGGMSKIPTASMQLNAI